MTEQEQIKEMAKEICPIAQAKILPCERCAFEKSCTAYVNATALYNAGYRKIDEIQLECENASLTVENEVLKRDVQNLERTLEECNEELEDLKAGENILLIESENARRKIEEYKAGETVTLTKSEYERLKKIEVNGVIDGFKLREAVRKETAKEILSYVGNLYEDGDEMFKLKDYEWHKKLCEKYGVEVKE